MWSSKKSIIAEPGFCTGSTLYNPGALIYCTKGFICKRMNRRHLLTIISIIIVYATVFGLHVRTVPFGDEPHYLIVTQTILKYHSLNVMQDYRRGDYHTFFPSHLAVHVVKSLNGKYYSMHGIGGPILWLIPFSFIGKAGALITMALVVLGILYHFYYLLLAGGIEKKVSMITTFLLALGSPLLMYSYRLFIEPIGALIVVYAFRKFLEKKQLADTTLVILGIVLSAIAWVHIRMVMLAIPLLILLLFKLYQQKEGKKKFLLLLLPYILVNILYELYSYKLWGSWNPFFYIARESTNFQNVSFLNNLIGIFFDNNYGLFTNFPLFLFIIPGVVLSVREGMKKINIAIVFTSIGYLILVASYATWFGGFSPPARYIFLILPLLGYYIAYTFQKVQKSSVHFLMILGCLVGFTYSILASFLGPYGFSAGFYVYFNRIILPLGHTLHSTSSTITIGIILLITLIALLLWLWDISLNRPKSE